MDPPTVVVILGGPLLAEFVLAVVLPWRIRWLILPGTLLALAYWTVVGWLGIGEVDLTRSDRLVVTGLSALLWIGTCYVAVRFGKAVRKRLPSIR